MHRVRRCKPHRISAYSFDAESIIRTCLVIISILLLIIHSTRSQELALVERFPDHWDRSLSAREEHVQSADGAGEMIIVVVIMITIMPITTAMTITTMITLMMRGVEEGRGGGVVRYSAGLLL